MDENVGVNLGVKTSDCKHVTCTSMFMLYLCLHSTGRCVLSVVRSQFCRTNVGCIYTSQ